MKRVTDRFDMWVDAVRKAPVLGCHRLMAAMPRFGVVLCPYGWLCETYLRAVGQSRITWDVVRRGPHGEEWGLCVQRGQQWVEFEHTLPDEVVEWVGHVVPGLGREVVRITNFALAEDGVDVIPELVARYMERAAIRLRG